MPKAGPKLLQSSRPAPMAHQPISTPRAPISRLCLAATCKNNRACWMCFGSSMAWSLKHSWQLSIKACLLVEAKARHKTIGIKKAAEGTLIKPPSPPLSAAIRLVQARKKPMAKMNLILGLYWVAVLSSSVVSRPKSIVNHQVFAFVAWGIVRFRRLSN